MPTVLHYGNTGAHISELNIFVVISCICSRRVNCVLIFIYAKDVPATYLPLFVHTYAARSHVTARIITPVSAFADITGGFHCCGVTSGGEHVN
jgi:hypothetical protein